MQATSDVINRFVTYVVDPAMLLVFAAGFFLFTYGLIEFLWNLNEGGEQTQGKQHMIWGVVGMFIMISVYGIISLLDNTFSLQIGNPDVSRVQNVNTGMNFFGK